MASPPPVTSFDVSGFEGFLEDLGPHFSETVHAAFKAAQRTIQTSPISTATFRVNVGVLPCIGLPLVSTGQATLYQTGFYVAYTIRNERIIPVDVDRMSNLR
jgi:hypothetical protein